MGISGRWEPRQYVFISVFFRSIFCIILFDGLLLLQIDFTVFCFSCSASPRGFLTWLKRDGNSAWNNLWEPCKYSDLDLNVDFHCSEEQTSFQPDAFALSLKEAGASCRMQICRKVFNIMLCDGLYLEFHFRSLFYHWVFCFSSVLWVLLYCTIV